MFVLNIIFYLSTRTRANCVYKLLFYVWQPCVHNFTENDKFSGSNCAKVVFSLIFGRQLLCLYMRFTIFNNTAANV